MTNMPPTGGSMGGPSSDDKTWGMLAHLSAFLCAPISCIVIFVTKAKESASVREQTLEALNWQITVLIGSIVLLILSAIIHPLMIILYLLYLVALIFPILGAVKAYGGEQYKYPWSLKLVK